MSEWSSCVCSSVMWCDRIIRSMAELASSSFCISCAKLPKQGGVLQLDECLGHCRSSSRLQSQANEAVAMQSTSAQAIYLLVQVVGTNRSK
mmetsp:Transcript_100152/g.238814  ORF Transcript_100152/g.238814 Transcript_100152/m.238814 type:complete len:91 (-) Transcript_100152:207-479(-)